MSKGRAVAGVTIRTAITTNCVLLSYKIGGKMLYAKMDELKKRNRLFNGDILINEQKLRHMLLHLSP